MCNNSVIKRQNCPSVQRSTSVFVCVRASVSCADIAARAHKLAGVTLVHWPGDPNKVDFGEMLLNSSFECGITERYYVAFFPGEFFSPFKFENSNICFFFRLLINSNKKYLFGSSFCDFINSLTLFIYRKYIKKYFFLHN